MIMISGVVALIKGARPTFDKELLLQLLRAVEKLALSCEPSFWRSVY